jgi:8-oxo-dGTP pyrophosphatase MutT (NUDIX family)
MLQAGAVINLQSAAIPYRRTDRQEVEILLITSRKRGRWVLPKGKVKRGHPPHASAALEAFEEAGVFGSISRIALGTYRQMKFDADGQPRPIAVRAFPMLVTGENRSWPEMSVRQRRWMPISKAAEAVKNGELRALLQQFAAMTSDYT